MKSEATHNKVQKFLFFIFIFSNEEALIIKKNDKIIDQAHKFSKKKKKGQSLLRSTINTKCINFGCQRPVLSIRVIQLYKNLSHFNVFLFIVHYYDKHYYASQ